MDGWIIALQILNFIVVTIVGFFLKSYLPSYFGEKGKNLATKEDISDITNRVEEVKAAYSAKIEGIRSAIAEISGNRNEYLHEQRACLLKFYDLSVEFFYEKLVVNFGDFPIDQGQSLAKYQSSFFELVSNLLKSYQRIVVYFDHKEQVRIEAENTLNQVLQARAVMKQYFGKVKLTAIDENDVALSGEKKRYNSVVEASNKADEEYWNAMRPVTTELQKSLQRYLTALNQFLRPDELPSIPKGVFAANQ